MSILLTLVGGTAGETIVPFKGCLVYKTSNQNIDFAVETAMTFDAEIYDTNDFHSTTANTSRITIPAGISFVRLAGQASWGSPAGVNEWRTIYIIKNGVLTADPGGVFRLVQGPASNGFLIQAGVTAVVPVVAGDFFELFAFQRTDSGGLSVQGNSTDRRTWFGMEVIE